MNNFSFWKSFGARFKIKKEMRCFTKFITLIGAWQCSSRNSLWASDQTRDVLDVGRDSLGVFSGLVSSCIVGLYKIECGGSDG